MNARKAKRKCNVRGCKNVGYMISLTREMGNSVIICRSCLAAALSAVKDMEKAKAKEEKEKAKASEKAQPFEGSTANTADTDGAESGKTE